MTALLFETFRKGDPPLRWISATVLAGLFILGIGLFKVQVLDRERYRNRQEVQSFRTVRVPAMRGRILDREGRVLAGNEPRYRIDLYLDELRPQFGAEYTRLRTALVASRGGPPAEDRNFWRRLAARFRRQTRRTVVSANDLQWLNRQARFGVVSNLVAGINHRLGTSARVTEEELYRHWLTKRALPYPVLEDLNPQQVALATEQAWSMPGLEIERVPVRSYPHGQLAAHVLGHVRRDDAFDEEERSFNYRLRDYRGAVGLEKAFDRELRGASGAKSILVNSAGYRHRQGELMLVEPRRGRDLRTTLDLDIQRAAEQAFTAGAADRRGAVVVMDPRNGDLLAVVSAPAFDPNQWITGVTHEEFALLMDPTLRPMFNRATLGIYPPGSTFKIASAAAFLESGILHPGNLATPMHTDGHYRIGNRVIDDTAPAGDYDFRRAFIRSSNSYFIDHALRLGLRRLLETGAALGFGEATGVDIGEEASGVFPAPGEVEGRWTRSHLADVSIGQQIAATPLQVATMVAAVANGGDLPRPRLVRAIDPGPAADGPDGILSAGDATEVPSRMRRRVPVHPDHLAVIRNAMRDDVASEEGTGRAARVVGMEVCGKTGTAEVKAGRRLIDKITWFASFAPHDAPRYVVVVMVESGGSGGGTCAPIARRIYERLRDRERSRSGEWSAR